MKKALCSLVLAAMLVSHAAAEDYYVDVFVRENPPPGLEWPTFSVNVLVWDDSNSGNWSLRKIPLRLGQWWSSESRHSLHGSPARWSAAIGSGSQRVKNYDTGKWWNITWGLTGSYNNSRSNVTTLKPNFSWKLDPSY